MTIDSRIFGSISWGDGPPPPSPDVNLSVGSTKLFDRISTGSAEKDYERSYSVTDTIDKVKLGKDFVSLRLQITNSGMKDSKEARVRFVLWGFDKTDPASGPKVGTYVEPEMFAVPGRQTTIEPPSTSCVDIKLPLDQLVWAIPEGVNLSNFEVSHIYAMIHEDISDFPDERWEEFWRESLKGEVNLRKPNPCRESIKMTCWTPFSLKGGYTLDPAPDPNIAILKDSTNRKLTNKSGRFIEIAVVKSDHANSPAILSYHRENSPLKIMLKNDPPNDRKIASASEGIHQEDVVFSLQWNGGKLCRSDNSSVCKVSLSDENRVISLWWEEGENTKFNDYRINIIHR